MVSVRKGMRAHCLTLNKKKEDVIKKRENSDIDNPTENNLSSYATPRLFKVIKFDKEKRLDSINTKAKLY